ncbi:MAG: HAD family hydrolase [Simkania sp.]|nr:HAD family hydrolase [Simkania sp.]
MNKAFFLDRDGVINRAIVNNGKSYPPLTLEQFEILPGVPEALNLLHKAGFLLIVVTNQPDVARGHQKKEVVEAMHAMLLREFPLHAIEVCYDENSPCYKPMPGMLLHSAQKHNIDLSASYMVGDRWRDISAGKTAGCYTVFIDHYYEEPLKERPDLMCTSLLEATLNILDHS